MRNKNEYLISGSGIGKIPEHIFDNLNEKLEEYYDIPAETNNNHFEGCFEYKAPNVLECVPCAIPDSSGCVKHGNRVVNKRAVSKRRKRNKNRKTHRK